jgi:hypothetical protein
MGQGRLYLHPLKHDHYGVGYDLDCDQHYLSRNITFGAKITAISLSWEEIVGFWDTIMAQRSDEALHRQHTVRSRVRGEDSTGRRIDVFVQRVVWIQG